MPLEKVLFPALLQKSMPVIVKRIGKKMADCWRLLVRNENRHFLHRLGNQIKDMHSLISLYAQCTSWTPRSDWRWARSASVRKKTHKPARFILHSALFILFIQCCYYFAHWAVFGNALWHLDSTQMVFAGVGKY